MSRKVSIVVPVYKVEKYLDRCVKSIINQTYSNLEILLVNDGSPDNCGMIADEYAKEDSRITVLHKKNGGLSDARNYGMGFITGEFTLFVDSDDWLDEQMVETAVNHMESHQADIVQTGFYYAYDGRLLYDNRCYSLSDPPVIIDNQTLMKELVIGEKVKNFAWGKLYKTSLIKDIPFKKGALFEDVFWAYQVFHRVEKYVILHQPLCFYYQRDDSIVATYTLRNLDILEAMKNRHQFIEAYYPHLIDESFKGILKESLNQYNLLLLNRKKDNQGMEKKKIKRYMNNHRKELVKAATENQAMKIELWLFFIHPYLNFSYLAGRKVLRKVKLLPNPIGLTVVSIQEEGR